MEDLRITALGTGDMGGAIATALSRRTRHTVQVRGSRIGSPSASQLIATLGIHEATDRAITDSDVVFVVVPALAIARAVAIRAGYRGIVVCVSVSNTVGRDGLPSSAEQIAAALPEARVVSAFTSMWSDVVRDPGAGQKTSVFVCSNDDGAKAAISRLAAEMGFDPINGGKLDTALYAEVLGALVVRLALDSGYGKNITFQAFQAKP